jgi:hypothetical protein
MSRKKKTKKIEQKIVELCQHQTPVYQHGLDSFPPCGEPATDRHEGKHYCAEHFRYHVEGRVSWDEYSEDGNEEYGQEEINLTIRGEDEKFNR